MQTRKVTPATFIVLLITLLFISSVGFSESYDDVYVIPIKGDITKATYQFLDKKVDEITKLNPAAIIFEIDTYGGLIEEANYIKDIIVSTETPTISFVNNKAESAGVLITIASERIAMADRATIGSAETIPNTEKVMSLWLSWLRDTARFRGRDYALIEAMVDREVEIEGVVDEGKLLNLSSYEAMELGFIDLVANDYETILEEFDIDYREIRVVDMDLRTKLAMTLTNSYISTLLLAVGFIGLLIEIMTPGFGFGGTISLIAFSLFFGGNVIAGNSGWGVSIIFIGGLLLIFIELIIPGFGLPGIGGVLAIILSIVLAMGSLQQALFSLTIAVAITIIAAILLIKYGYKSPYLDKIILATKQESKSGYIGNVDTSTFLNKEGVALTYLRPAGTIEVEGARLDAVSEGTFIEKGAKIKIVRVEGHRTVVRKI